MDLKSRLALVADLWRAAWSAEEGTEVSLGRLSKRVVDDGKFFDNLADMRRGPSTDTLEKFARHLADRASWPDGRVPPEARTFAAICGVATGCAACGKADCGHSEPEIAGVVPPVHTSSDHAAEVARG